MQIDREPTPGLEPGLLAAAELPLAALRAEDQNIGIFLVWC
jgi:hypothetical protein